MKNGHLLWRVFAFNFAVLLLALLALQLAFRRAVWQRTVEGETAWLLREARLLDPAIAGALRSGQLEEQCVIASAAAGVRITVIGADG
ncbi:hypothetical protein HZA57_00230, partial [Candidatus Poribacteria bacterium]|nr:hypothetical protein [Candidatus Poribacteria bacterium]